MFYDPSESWLLLLTQCDVLREKIIHQQLINRETP